MNIMLQKFLQKVSSDNTPGIYWSEYRLHSTHSLLKYHCFVTFIYIYIYILPSSTCLSINYSKHFAIYSAKVFFKKKDKGSYRFVGNMNLHPRL